MVILSHLPRLFDLRLEGVGLLDVLDIGPLLQAFGTQLHTFHLDRRHFRPGRTGLDLSRHLPSLRTLAVTSFYDIRPAPLTLTGPYLDLLLLSMPESLLPGTLTNHTSARDVLHHLRPQRLAVAGLNSALWDEA